MESKMFVEVGKTYSVHMKDGSGDYTINLTGSMEFKTGCLLMAELSQGAVSPEELAIEATECGYENPAFFTGTIDDNGEPYFILLSDFLVDSVVEVTPDEKR